MPGRSKVEAAMSEGINHQFSGMDHSNGLLVYGNSSESIVPEGRLVRLFYENFHSAHPRQSPL
jgi:hypothetical protein